MCSSDLACELMRGLDVHMTPPYQVRLPVPEAEVTAVELGFAWSPWDPEGDAIGDGDLDYTVLWRVGAPVELETERMEFAGYAFDYAVGPSAWDGMAEGSPATVRIDPPDGDLYVTVLHANCPVTWLDVDVAWEHPIPEEPRACGCETGAGPGWLGLVGLLLRRRR